MKAQVRRIEARHGKTEAPLSFGDVVEEVSGIAANPVEAAFVIDRMLRRRKIRFADDFDARWLV